MMRNILQTIFGAIFLTFLSTLSHAQLQPFGMPGETITAVALFPTEIYPYRNYLCAGTDSNGVFIRNLDFADSVWVNKGLVGKKVSALNVYYYGYGQVPVTTIVSGMHPNQQSGDSTLLYARSVPYGGWVEADSGLDINSITHINAIDGFFFPQHSAPEPIFCANGGNVYRAAGYPDWGLLDWHNVWTMGSSGIINVIYVYRIGFDGSDGTLWAGGETGYLQPLLLKSTDKGTNWDVFLPDLGGDNACNSIAVDPLHPDTVYAGMEGLVIKTVDGGLNWTVTGLHSTPYYFNGLAINPANPEHVIAGGAISYTNEFGLFETYDGGNNWSAILQTDTIAGISSMDAQIEGNEFVVYIGTMGDGVYRYKSPLTGIKDNDNVAADFRLFQNNPNPFNPTTVISWQLAVGNGAGVVELAIYNLLGQKIRTLVSGRKPAGAHQVKWDGRDDAGREVASGIYIYRLKARDQILSRKMLLLH